MSERPRTNTDRELWREREGDYYADSIHVTEGGGIGIDHGGTVIVMPLAEWHKRAAHDSSEQTIQELLAALKLFHDRQECPWCYDEGQCDVADVIKKFEIAAAIRSAR